MNSSISIIPIYVWSLDSSVYRASPITCKVLNNEKCSCSATTRFGKYPSSSSRILACIPVLYSKTSILHKKYLIVWRFLLGCFCGSNRFVALYVCLTRQSAKVYFKYFQFFTCVRIASVLVHGSCLTEWKLSKR